MSSPIEQMGISYYPTKSILRRTGLSYAAIKYVAAATDFVIVLSSNAAGFVLYEKMVFDTFNDPSLYVGMGLVAATIFVLAMSGAQAYRPEQIMVFRRQTMLVFTLIPTVLGFLLTVIFFLKLGATFSRGAILTIAFISTTTLLGTRYVWYSQVARTIARGMFRRKRVLLICPDTFAVESLGGKTGLSGITVTHVLPLAEGKRLATLSGDVLKRSGDVDEVVVVWRDSSVAELEECLAALSRFPLSVNVVFDSFVGGIVSGASQKIGGMQAFQTQRLPLSASERGFKRGFDIVFSIFALVLLSPIFLVVAIAIKLESKGPVLFIQSRKGYGGDPFRILKFRSMRVMEDADTLRQATRNDPRVTRVGAFIRAASIDELPQFWNVLRGEMSVVGPRPHAVVHDDLYDTLISEYVLRRHVKPGVTGWAQVSGCRGETPTVERMKERVLHDLWYINNWSPWLDLKIILRTMILVPDVTNAY